MSDEEGWKGGGTSANPDPMAKLVRRLGDLDKQIRESLRRTLQAAGISLSKAGMTIASALTVNGDLESTGNATFSGDTNIGGDLDVTGQADFSGDTTIAGDLLVTGAFSFPPDSIENEWLTSPVSYDAGYDDNMSLNLTSSEQTFCSKTFTVPSGYTRALVVGFGSIGVTNPTANQSSVAGRIYVESSGGYSSWGPRWFQLVEPGLDGGTFPNKQSDFAVSGGQTVTVRMVVLNTGANWGATPGGASLNAFLIYTR